jgi:hypothetical protein
MRSDLRGFVFGLSIGLAALAGFGAANRQGDAGRYQVAASESNGAVHVYLLDTTRGHLYERFATGEFKAVPTPSVE